MPKSALFLLKNRRTLGAPPPDPCPPVAADTRNNPPSSPPPPTDEFLATCLTSRIIDLHNCFLSNVELEKHKLNF